MANPNIVNVTDIRGKTAVQNIGTSATAIVTNAAGSNKVLKINSLIVSNIDGTNAADLTVTVVRSATSYALASTITIPADATLVVISKDSAIYLEEDDSLTLLASAAGDLQAICSYEEIS
jgi:hypothetical protein